MRLLVIIAGSDQAVNLDVAGEMQLADFQALLEAETGIAATDQALLLRNKPITGSSSTLQSQGVTEDDMLLLQSSRASVASTSASSSMPRQDEAETMRLQLLANRDLMDRIRQAMPALANAAERDPAEFRRLLPQLTQMQNDAALQRQRSIQALNDDPFNVDAQRQIEEAIQQEQIFENMEHAMEYSPESFGRVHMLYVQTEVNKQPVKAFVDSGAQATIMSPECAEACGLMRLIDKRFAGIARGVGTAKIIGRIHSAQIKVGDDLFLACSFTVMEGKGVDLLFGLDMLKRHQAVIDLAQDALIIQGRKIRFLSEHELPVADEPEVDANGNIILPPDSQASANTPAALGAAAAANTAAKAPQPSSQSSYKPFGGQGNTLSSAPSGSQASQHPETAIESLVALGVSRPEAIQLLDASGGNAEMAASLLFSR